MKNSKLKGVVCGIVSAVCYGINPIGKLLYSDGISTNTLLIYRFSLAAIVFAVMMAIKKVSFKTNRYELVHLLVLGLLFAASSMTLFFSFLYMDAGVASTLLFSYPVMVAIIMFVCFHERLQLSTIGAIMLAFCGIALLSNGGDGSNVSLKGMVLVLISALTYAIYIVYVNRTMKDTHPMKVSFFVALCCIVCNVLQVLIDPSSHFTFLTAPKHLLVVVLLAIMPTVIALSFLVVSAKNIGSTPTAVLGALEPLTAVLIGVLLFKEAFTMRLLAGIVLILSSVVLIVLKDAKGSGASTSKQKSKSEPNMVETV